MMNLRNKLMSFVAGTYLLAGSNLPANAADLTFESTFTKAYSYADAKITGSLTDKVRFFLQNITTVNNKSKSTSNFGVVDGIFPLGKGLDAVAEFQFPSGFEAELRPGFQYFVSIGDLFMGGLVTRKFGKNPDTEFNGLLIYTPKIGSDSKLIASLASGFKLGDFGNNYDFSKFRLGIKKGSVSGGLAIEIVGLSSGIAPDVQPGLFVSVDM